MVDITGSVQKELSKAGVDDGFCVVYVPHTTAGVTINEGADPAVCHDILSTLNKLVPQDPSYRHMEGNSDSHMKASIMGSSVTVMIENNKLTDEAVAEAEFGCFHWTPRLGQRRSPLRGLLLVSHANGFDLLLGSHQ